MMNMMNQTAQREEVLDFGDEVRRLGLRSVDILKLDCEGCEWDVLRSLHQHGLWDTVRLIRGEWHHSSPSCFRLGPGDWRQVPHHLWDQRRIPDLDDDYDDDDG